jgi:hypothetical protein
LMPITLATMVTIRNDIPRIDQWCVYCRPR